MPLFQDQLGRKILVRKSPRHIISLVPSQTELLYHLGLDEEVRAITKFCIHPEEWFRNKTRIGGTKNLHLDAIRALQPDVIIANKEENEKDQVEALGKDFPVWVSDVNNLEQALEMISSIGAITGKQEKAIEIRDQITTGFEQLPAPAAPLLPCCYLIWKDPYITVGGNCFINDMLRYAGFENIFESLQRYPSIDLAGLKDRQLVLMLSSEPFPFAEKHCKELQQLLPLAKIVLVDGEMFSWYGSRLRQSPSYFARLRREIGTIA